MAATKKPIPRTKPKGKQTTNRTVYYKRASFLPDETGGETLSDYLDRALAKKNRPGRRMEKIGASSDNVRVINKCYVENAMICGRFLDYTEGGAQAVIEMDDDADELSIKSIPPGKREQYLQGVLTFGVQGDHIFLIQSKNLQHGHLENHLNWLLSKATNTLADGVRLFIKDQASPGLLSQLTNVSSIVLKESVSTGSFILEAEQAPSDTLGPVIAALQQMVPKVRDIFGARLTPEQALALEQLKVELKISRVRKSGSVSAFDEIAHALRKVEDVEVIVRAKGEIIKSDELRLAVARSIELASNGMLDLKDSARVMQAWLSYLVGQNRVPG